MPGEVFGIMLTGTPFALNPEGAQLQSSVAQIRRIGKVLKIRIMTI
jgi:hypothetical protein